MDDEINLPYAYGFVNFTGAACWLNSMVQAVMGCHSLNNILSENKGEGNKDDVKEDNNKNTKMMELYNTVIKQYSSANNNKIFTLHGIMMNLSDNSGIVQNINNQNDPTEFIQLFIERLGKEASDKCIHTVKSTILCNDHKHETRDNGVLMPVALNHITDLIGYLK